MCTSSNKTDEQWVQAITSNTYRVCTSSNTNKTGIVKKNHCYNKVSTAQLVYLHQSLSKHQKISSTPVRKVIFFCAAILHLLLAKMFKSRTTLFQYFSPRIPKIQKVWILDFGKWGQKDV